MERWESEGWGGVKGTDLKKGGVGGWCRGGGVRTGREGRGLVGAWSGRWAEKLRVRGRKRKGGTGGRVEWEELGGRGRRELMIGVEME